MNRFRFRWHRTAPGRVFIHLDAGSGKPGGILVGILSDSEFRSFKAMLEGQARVEFVEEAAA